MKVIFFTSYYPYYLNKLYKDDRNLLQASYEEQMNRITNDYFGDWSFYIDWFNKMRAEAHLVIPNCKPLQKAWARENNIEFHEKDWQFTIPVAQAKLYRPDVFYIGNMFEYYGQFLNEIKKYVKKIFAWIAVTIPPGIKLDQLELILSSHPLYVQQFRDQGLNSEYLTAAFEPGINNALRKETTKDIDFSFIGSLTPEHLYRIKMVKELIEHTPLEVYGPGISAIPDKRNAITKMLKPSIYQKRYKGPAWGLDMYKILKRSKITFNAHIDMSAEYIGNMRMFEATGVGTLLLTDGKHSRNKLFDQNEVVFYDGVNDAIEKLNYYLNNETERKTIAAKGQLRTLSDYSYEITSRKLFDHFSRYLKN